MYTKFVYVYIKNKKSRKKLKNKKTDRKIQTKKPVTGHASPQGGPPPLSLSPRALRDAPRGGRCAVIHFFSLLS